MAQVTLNSHQYIYRGKLRRRSQQPFAEAFRTLGVQRLEQVTTASRFVFPVPRYGFGLARIRDIEDPIQLQKFVDSTVETRFDGQVTLPLLAQTPTAPGVTYPAFYNMTIGGNHAGVLYALAFSTDGANFALETFYQSGTSWNNVDGGPGTGAGANWSGQQFLTHKAYRYWLLAVNRSIVLYQSPAGIASGITGVGNPGVTANWPGATILTNNVTINEDIRAGVIHDYGNTLLVAYWNESAGTIGVAKSADAGTTWTAVSTALVGSKGGPTGWATYFDQTGAVVPMLGTAEGVYAVDLTNNVAKLVLPLDSDANNCRGMGVWPGDSALYVPTGAGGMKRYEWNGSVAIIDEVGPNKGDGLPATRQGHCTYTKFTDRWIFMAYGGHTSSTYASIFAYDGKGWHHITQWGTLNKEIRWLDIATPNGIDTLYYTVPTSIQAESERYLQYINDNPKVQSAPHESTGYLIRPEFNGGFPRDQAAWLLAYYDATGLTTALAEYIALAYGLDGADAATTTLGNIVAADQDLAFGSGAGVAGKSIALKETYNHDATNTHTPMGRSLELTYLKRPDELEAWSFLVDVEATARQFSRDVEAVIAELEGLRPPDKVTLVPFKYGRVAVKQVVVEPLDWGETLEDSDELPILAEDRAALVQVTVREVM